MAQSEDDMDGIKIDRTEQWEYTAYGYELSATGTSELSAEKNLLEKLALKLKQENEDYKLMLKALANGWVVWLNEGVWWWGYFAYDDDGDKVFSIESTQSDIPEINDELREEFKKI